MKQHSRCALRSFSNQQIGCGQAERVLHLSSTPLCFHDELGVLLFAALIRVTFVSLKVFIPRVFATRKHLWA